MLNIQKMRADREKLIVEMRAITQTAEKRADKALTPDEDFRWKKLSDEIDVAAGTIKSEERYQEKAALESVAMRNDGRDSGYLTGYHGEVAPRGRSYRNLFHPGQPETSTLDNGGFASHDEYFRTIISGRSDNRLELLEKRQQVIGSPTLGGYAVTAELTAWLMDQSLDGEIVRSRATVWPMASDERKVPAWNIQDTSSSVAGLVGVWIEELGTNTPQEALLRQIILKAKKLAIYTQASREIMEDGLQFGQQLTSIMVQAMGYFMDLAFFVGSGAGQPVGIIDAPGTIAVTRTEADSINFRDIVNMLGQLAPGSFANAIWVASQEALPLLMTTASTHVVGTAGSYIPLVNEINGKFTILGKELLFTEKVPGLGQRGDLGLYDFGQYAIGMRKDIVIDQNVAPGWTTDALSLRTLLRVDGQPHYGEPLTQRSGLLVSPFVVLDDDVTTTQAP